MGTPIFVHGHTWLCSRPMLPGHWAGREAQAAGSPGLGDGPTLGRASGAYLDGGPLSHGDPGMVLWLSPVRCARWPGCCRGLWVTQPCTVCRGLGQAAGALSGTHTPCPASGPLQVSEGAPVTLAVPTPLLGSTRPSPACGCSLVWTRQAEAEASASLSWRRLCPHSI